MAEFTVEDARADEQAVKRLRAELGPDVLNGLLNRFPGDQGRTLRAAIYLAYEAGYDDGGNSARADMHEDNPSAVKLALEIIRAKIEQG